MTNWSNYAWRLWHWLWHHLFCWSVKKQACSIIQRNTHKQTRSSSLPLNILKDTGYYFDTVIHVHTDVRLGSGSVSQHKEVGVRSKLVMAPVGECNHFFHDPIYYKHDPSQSTPHNHHHPFSLLYLPLECRFIVSCLKETLVSEKNTALVPIFTRVTSWVWSRQRKWAGGYSFMVVVLSWSDFHRIICFTRCRKWIWFGTFSFNHYA